MATSDAVLDAVGIVGRWQVLMFVAVGAALIPAGFPTLVLTFMNAEIDFWCARPDHLAHLQPDEWREISGQEEDACAVFDIDYTAGIDSIRQVLSNLSASGSNSPARRACDDWEFDSSVLSSTIVTEWALVCGRSFKLGLAQSLYFLGMLVSVCAAGVLSDRLGRKPVLVALVLVVSAAGVITAAMPTFETFLVARTMASLGAMAIVTVAITYLLEIVGGKWLTVFGLGIEFFWVASWLILGTAAYFIRDWRTLMLATSLPGLAFVGLIWAMPESPRWLAVTGRTRKAEDVLRRVADINGRPLPVDWSLPLDLHPDYHRHHRGGKKASASASSSGSAGFLDLLRTPRIRNKTLIIWLNWFANNLTYYGLTLNSGQLGAAGGDMFGTFMLNGALEIPAYSLAIALLLFCGRRVPYSLCLVLSGAMLLAIVVVPLVTDADWVVPAVASAGKFLGTVSFGIIILYSGELFPTVLRSTGLSAAALFGRAGGLAASPVAMLSFVHRHLPVVLVGLTAVASGLAALALPDTHEDSLPDTVNDCETSDDDSDGDEDEEEQLTSVTSPCPSTTRNTSKLIGMEKQTMET